MRSRLTSTSRPWTLESLERELRAALTDRARLRQAPLPSNAAEVEWTEGLKARITLDSFSVGHLRGTLHELMHVVLDSHLSPFADELAESAIESWEEALSDRIMGSPRRKSWWRKAINGKLPR